MSEDPLDLKWKQLRRDAIRDFVVLGMLFLGSILMPGWGQVTTVVIVVAAILCMCFYSGLSLMVDILLHLRDIRQNGQKTIKQMDELASATRLIAQRQASGSARVGPDPK